MKVKILTDIIRKVVNEEVRKVVRSEMKKMLTENTTVSKKPINTDKTVQYTKNKSINDILNETAGGIPHDPSTDQQSTNEEWPTMNNKTYKSGDLASLMGYGEVKDNPQAGVAETFQSMGKNVDPDDPVAKAMTRNYGDLMKAMDKRKGKPA